MSAERIARVLRIYLGASPESAQRYIDLRDEGHSQYAASIMAGLADPYDPEPDERVKS